MNARPPYLSILLTVLCQLIGMVTGIFFYSLGAQFVGLATVATAPIALAVHALVALTIAWTMQLNGPWQLVNLLLAPAVLLATQTNFPAQAALAIAVGLALIHLPAIWTLVPYYPTSRMTYAAIAKLLPRDSTFHFIDLGCGVGRLLSYLANEFPNGRFSGVELAPLPYLVAKFRALRSHGRVQVRFQSIWNTKLADVDIAYAFLSPAPMAQLEAKIRSEMRANSVFISNSFPVSCPADQEIVVRDHRDFVLYVYRQALKH